MFKVIVCRSFATFGCSLKIHWSEFFNAKAARTVRPKKGDLVKWPRPLRWPSSFTLGPRDGPHNTKHGTATLRSNNICTPSRWKNTCRFTRYETKKCTWPENWCFSKMLKDYYCLILRKPILTLRPQLWGHSVHLERSLDQSVSGVGYVWCGFFWQLVELFFGVSKKHGCP